MDPFYKKKKILSEYYQLVLESNFLIKDLRKIIADYIPYEEIILYQSLPDDVGKEIFSHCSLPENLKEIIVSYSHNENLGITVLEKDYDFQLPNCERYKGFRCCIFNNSGKDVKINGESFTLPHLAKIAYTCFGDKWIAV